MASVHSLPLELEEQLSVPGLTFTLKTQNAAHYYDFFRDYNDFSPRSPKDERENTWPTEEQC
ncbi:MAG TPA: hypothetical protein VJQ50_11530 [Terriglobales bacterium]|nr:hypothetical protein [Terriglobales bacterium]